MRGSGAIVGCGLGIAVAVGGACAGSARAATNGEPIDTDYKVLAHDGRTDADPYQIYVFVKAAAQDGKLRVCGSYVAEMSDKRFDQVIRALRNPSSYLRLGAAGGPPYHARTSFLTGTRSLPVQTTPLSEHLPRNRMRASCLDTDVPWRDDYATADPAMSLYDLHNRPAIFGPGNRF